MSDSLKILMKKAVSLNDLRDVEFSFGTNYFSTVTEVCQEENLLSSRCTGHVMTVEII